jgi:long-chain acyl-CoA synthetase
VGDRAARRLETRRVVAALNPIYTENELATLLRATGARYAHRAHPRVRPREGRAAADGAGTGRRDQHQGVPAAHLAALFTLFKEKKEGHRISLAPGDRWFQDLLRANDGATPPAVRLTGEDDAIVLASGGTTGTPKGVVGQHKGFVYAGSQIEAWTKSIFDSGKDIVLLPLPLCHVYANVGGLGLGFVTGSPVALIPNPRDLADVLKTIHSVKPAFMMGVPTLFQAMLNNPDVQKGRIDFSSIKVSFSGAGGVDGGDQAAVRVADWRPHHRGLLADGRHDGVPGEPDEGRGQDRVDRPSAA